MGKFSDQFEVQSGCTRIRLEDYLFERFRDLSRMYIRDVLRSGKCEVNGRVENKGKRVSAGDYIEIEIDPNRETAMRAEDRPLDIVFEDSDVVVLHKPAGMLVHPSHQDRSGTLLNALAFHLNRNGQASVIRPGLIHRLDRETSGLIVVAKNLRAHRILSKQFERKTVEKKYVALVEGVVEPDSGVIDAPIGRYADEKRWDVKLGSKPSVTNFNVRRRFEDTTLLELEPVTGRTNQLRIHCAFIGHPIVGDVERGGRAHERLCLHAYHLAFRSPANGVLEKFTIEIPQWNES